MTLDKKRALDALLARLTTDMDLEGFTQKGAVFVRDYDEKQDIVHPTAIRKTKGRVGFLYGARVRFPALESILRGNNAKASLSGTYGGLSHLIAGESYYDWTVSEEGAIPEVGRAVLKNIKLVALPFFEQHKSVKDILTSLADNQQLLSFSEEEAIVCRAASLWLLDRQREAKDLLIKALDERKTELPKKRIEIEGLLGQFLKS